MTNDFLGLDAKHADYRGSRFAMLPIPYDATVSYQVGTRFGPQAIISASQQVELFDDELGTEPFRAGICTLDPVGVCNDGPATMHEAIVKAAGKPVRDGKFLFGLGGEHGVTSGLVRAVASRYKKLSILQIDAHLDLRDQYEGSPYSHASVMRRCLEHVETVVPVGIRNVSKEESTFLKKSDIEPIYARDCRGGGEWIERALEGLGNTVYVTIDIDGFDPAYAPGTGTPEPGGLDWYQVTSLLRRVAQARRIVAADIVEVLPIPGQVVTEFLAARLAYRLMAYVHAASK
jgi:agmatinase